MIKKIFVSSSFIFITLLLFLTFAKKSLAADVDLKCFKYKFVFSDLDCELEDSKDFSYQYQDQQFCENHGLSCDWDKEICYLKDDHKSGTQTLSCLTVLDSSKCSPACTGSDQCRLVNPLASVSGKSEDWRCVKETVEEAFNLNLFGINFGPPDVAIAKLLRTMFSVVLAISGGRIAWVIFMAIWHGALDRKEESFEKSKKTMSDILQGLLWAGIGLVGIQAISTIFGISHNIFEFSYTP